jgi:hypothetical protein
MKNQEIWYEMARRKLRFHQNEDWDKINLWGLFDWQDVKRLLDRGLLLTSMEKKNKTIWVTPSKEAWDNHIKPLIDQYSLDELEKLAGW